jgi:hypothetical protein
MLFKRALSLVALAVGCAGVLACLAGVYGVWLAKSRLGDANNKLGEALDRGFATAQNRINSALSRINDSKLSTSSLGDYFRDRTAAKAKERALSPLEVEARAEKLAGQLQSAEDILGTSIEVVQGAQAALELGSLLGAPADPGSLEGVLVKLNDARSKTKQAEGLVVQVQKLVAGKEGDSDNSRFSRAAKLAARTVVTIGDVDTRLEEARAQLSELQVDARRLTTRMGDYIFLTAIGAWLILAWIATGQVALLLLARRSWYQSRSFPFDTPSRK